MRHHTKDKGDQGLGFVIADLMANGINVALPISEHQPFDCIAISEDGRLMRLSVKYRTLKNGALRITKKSHWADKYGSHTREHKTGDYDAFAVYCPDTKTCYYLNWTDFASKSIYLRVEAPKRDNGGPVPIKLAAAFVGPQRLFKTP